MKSGVIYIVDYLAACLLLCISSEHINLHYENLSWLFQKNYDKSFGAVTYLLCSQLNSIAELEATETKNELLSKLLFDMDHIKTDFDSQAVFEKIKPQTKQAILGLCNTIIAGEYRAKNSEAYNEAFAKIKTSLNNPPV